MQKNDSVYLFLGDDWVSKQRRISRIKQDSVKKDSLNFNIDTFYADEISSDQLKNGLYTLASIGGKRILVVKKIEKLSARDKKLILDFIEKPNPGCILILETEICSAEKDSFLKRVSKLASTVNLKTVKREENVFDLCRMVAQKKNTSALRVLSNLLLSGQKPLKILGGISWYWTNKNITPNPQALKRDIDLLLKTDTNIKTGKIDPRFALEFLVLRLAS